MNQTPDNSNNSTKGKRPLISLPFIVVVGALAIAGYYGGPWIMTRFMLMEEKQKANTITIPDEFAELSQLARDLQANPNTEWKNDAMGGDEGDWDPETAFDEHDADNNGQLEGDEISGPLVESISELDTDADGIITKQEFLTAIQGSSPPSAGSDNQQAESDD